MTKYQTIVEAEIYVEGMESGWDWVDVYEDNKRAMESWLGREIDISENVACQLPYVWNEKSNEPEYIAKGDYIVTDLFGNRHVYDPSIFHELFKKY